METIQVDVVGETDIGLVRERNEDAFLVLELARGERHAGGFRKLQVGERGLVFSVFDGMGGAAGGDRASRLAAEVFAEGVMESRSGSRSELLESMGHALHEAHLRIRAEGAADLDLQGMGTTITAAAVLDSTLVLVHVGDSRAYLFRGGDLVQLTEDQSLIQELVSTGQIPREEAPLFEHNNVILQALGVTDELRPFAAELALCRRDLLLLCTDGLTTMVPQEEIRAVLAEKSDDLEATAHALTELARMHGGHDNVTLVLARFDGGELPAPAAGAGERLRVRQLELGLPRLPRQGLSPLALVALAVLLMAAVAGVILLIGMDWR